MVVSILIPLANVQGDDPQGTVTGIVILEQDPPAPLIVKLKPDMQMFTGKKTLSIQRWLVGSNRGLANCVVTLRAKDGTAQAVPKPLENAVLEKDGPFFVPRLLVVTNGTRVTYRNKNSPCKCFHVAGRRHPSVNRLIPAGSQYEMQFDGGHDICPVRADLRPYMLSWIYVVETPCYAVTDEKGHFEITGIPPGEYHIRVWHEGIGWVHKASGPRELTITGAVQEKLEFKAVRPETKRK
jgi:hypothetical protein